jgi:hypothetical protein
MLPTFSRRVRVRQPKLLSTPYPETIRLDYSSRSVRCRGRILWMI